MSSRDFDFKLRVFDYLQTEKINQLFNQLTERTEKTSIKQQKNDKSKQVSVKAGVGNLLSSLGLGVDVSGGVSNARSESEETLFEIFPEQKLKTVWSELTRKDCVADLNECIRNRTSPPTSIVLVQFKVARARMSFVSSGDAPSVNERMIKVSGTIENYQTEFFCSTRYCLASSISYDIQNEIAREIHGIAAVKQIHHKQKTIVLNPIAF